MTGKSVKRGRWLFTPCAGPAWRRLKGLRFSKTSMAAAGIHLTSSSNVAMSSDR
jgi:hypothetical protein